MRAAIVAILVIACGDNFTGKGTPEQVIGGAKDGQKVEVTGDVFAVTWDSTQAAARKLLLATHRDSVEWMLEQEDEAVRGRQHAFDDAGAKYPRTLDRYILIRTVKPDGITNGV